MHHPKYQTKIINIILMIKIIALICFPDEISDYTAKQNQNMAVFTKKQQIGIANQKNDLIDSLFLTKSKFIAWELKREIDIELFKKEMIKKWGIYFQSTNTEWVEYNNKRNAVSLVNFKNGRISFWVLVNKNESKQIIARKVEREIKRKLTNDCAKDCAKDTIFYQNKIIHKKKETIFLDGQIIDNRGQIITIDKVSKFAKNISYNYKIFKSSKHKNKQAGDNKTSAFVMFKLAPNHLKQRIKKYLPIVEKYCNKYGLNKSRVLATIHIESNFNPMALSSAHAVGLMQLVPKYGGQEAYGFVHKSNSIPKDSYLYNPENNIELGCAYIYLLNNKYFQKINIEKKKSYCTISAYNTGPFNVAYAFIGKRSLGNAISVINSMKSATVYSHLISKLPYKETRRYLQNVTSKMKLYQIESDGDYYGNNK